MIDDGDSARALYRSEALRGQTYDNAMAAFGSPMAVRAAVGFTAIAILLLCFVCSSDYSRRVRVTGKVIFEEGVERLYAPIDGIIVKRMAAEGAFVKAGDSLFLVTGDHHPTGHTSAATSSLEQLHLRLDLYKAELRRLKLQQDTNRQLVTQKAALLRTEVAHSKAEVELQSSAVKINDENLERLRPLLPDKYIPIVTFKEKEQANQDAHGKLHTLEHDLATGERQLNEAEADRVNFDARALTEVSIMQREMAALQQDIVDAETRREEVIHSKIAGVVTAVLADEGQRVTTSQLLASVIPSGGSMAVQLNVPSSAIGLIEIGHKVLLRYASFPYEQFGQFDGQVSAVPTTALTGAELKLAEETKELFYPVTVRISSRTVSFQDKTLPLREGMAVDADVLLESRKLVAWLLQPALLTVGRYDPK